MSDMPSAFIAHATMGRMRLRIPAKKADSSYFTSIKALLEKCEGVESVETNLLTSSVLIIHNSDMKSICGYAEANGLFIVKEMKTCPDTVYEGVSNFFERLNKRVKGITGNGLDLGSLSFLALAGIGIYQISRGNFSAPAWYTAFWYALNIFLKSKPYKNRE